MERNEQSNFFPWDVVTADTFIKEIKPAHGIASVEINNSGNTTVYLWQSYKLEPGASMQMTAQQTAFISLSKVPVHFVTDGVTDPVLKLTVIAEKVTLIQN